MKEDPGFALGYAGIADCCLGLRQWNLDLDANLERADAMVAKALELDPGLAEAHSTRGLALQAGFRLREAEEEFKEAIRLKPSYATARQWYMWTLLPQRRWAEALETIEKAVALDPLSPIINKNLGDYYLSVREYPKAVDPYARAVELGMYPCHGDLAFAYGKLGEFDRMKSEYAKFEEALRDTLPMVRVSAEMVMAYVMDDKETVRRLLPEAEAHPQETGMNLYSAALFRFYLGEPDAGFRLVEESYAKKEDSLLSISYDQDLDGVRKDPRYISIIERLGLA